jgi:hypothetical protein
MAEELEDSRCWMKSACQIESKNLALTHDALTNLPNRELFWDRLEHTLAQARRSPKLFAVLRLDLHPTQSLTESTWTEHQLPSAAQNRRPLSQLLSAPATPSPAWGAMSSAVLLDQIAQSRQCPAGRREDPGRPG